ncbi:MAG TPA: hypothetical protein PLF38_08415 [Xylanibacter oryzae]|nr:hypothetical protein [Xylanibacter oryzae]
MKRLMRITNIFSCDSEEEAAEVIDQASEEGILVKKTKKGEVIAEKLKVTTVVDANTDWFDDLEEE